MKSNILVLVFLVFQIGHVSWSQKGGLYGKNRFVEFSLVGNSPVINNLSNKAGFYVKNGSNSLVEGSDRFNGGFYGAIGIAPRRNFAISLSGGLWYSNSVAPNQIFFPDSYSYSGYSSIYVYHENLSIRTMTIMPILHFGGSRELLPVGLSHELGFGYSSSSVVKKDYVVRTNGSNIYANNQLYTDIPKLIDSIVAVNGSYINYDQKYKGFVLMYGLKFRTPLNKRLMLNYGIRYTVNFVNNEGYNTYSTPNNYNYNNALFAQIVSQIRRTQLRNLLSLNIGLSFAF